jgi:hypothetical protein
MKIQNILIIMFLIGFITTPIYADVVISTKHQPGVLIADENGYAYWGNVELKITDTNIMQQYEVVDKEDVIVKWIFGVLFILIGTILLVSNLFDNKMRYYS